MHLGASTRQFGHATVQNLEGAVNTERVAYHHTSIWIATILLLDQKCATCWAGATKLGLVTSTNRIASGETSDACRCLQTDNAKDVIPRNKVMVP